MHAVIFSASLFSFEVLNCSTRIDKSTGCKNFNKFYLSTICWSCLYFTGIGFSWGLKIEIENVFMHMDPHPSTHSTIPLLLLLSMTYDYSFKHIHINSSLPLLPCLMKMRHSGQLRMGEWVHLWLSLVVTLLLWGRGRWFVSLYRSWSVLTATRLIKYSCEHMQQKHLLY